MPEAPNPYDATRTLHACVPEGEKAEREALLMEATRGLRCPKRTKEIHRDLNKVLNVEHIAGRLRTA